MLRISVHSHQYHNYCSSEVLSKLQAIYLPIAKAVNSDYLVLACSLYHSLLRYTFSLTLLGRFIYSTLEESGEDTGIPLSC